VFPHARQPRRLATADGALCLNRRSLSRVDRCRVLHPDAHSTVHRQSPLGEGPPTARRARGCAPAGGNCTAARPKGGHCEAVHSPHLTHRLGELRRLAAAKGDVFRRVPGRAQAWRESNRARGCLLFRYPALDVALISAPARMSAKAAAVWPSYAATISAVHLPCSRRRLLNAQAFDNGASLLQAARLYPPLFFAATSAPAEMSSSTARAEPLHAACMSAVYLPRRRRPDRRASPTKRRRSGLTRSRRPSRRDRRQRRLAASARARGRFSPRA
jgi:hypothetical protein